jgi:hypothetical protein
MHGLISIYRHTSTELPLGEHLKVNIYKTMLVPWLPSDNLNLAKIWLKRGLPQ